MIDFKSGALFKLKANEEYRHTVDRLLVQGETVIGSFKGIRDGVVFTDGIALKSRWSLPNL